MKMPEFLAVPVAVQVQELHSSLARLVILIQTGTHLIFDALICPYKMGERVTALRLLRSVTFRNVVDVGQGFAFIRNGVNHAQQGL